MKIFSIAMVIFLAMLHGSPPAGSQFNIVWHYEASALAAPQSFRDACDAAAAIFKATIRDNVTIHIQVGYGDYKDGSITGITTQGFGQDNGAGFLSYTSIRAALAAKALTANQISFVNALPNTSSIQGQSFLNVVVAGEKALGIGGIDPHSTSLDGYIGIGTAIAADRIVGVIIVETAHVLGLEDGFQLVNLGHFSAAGTRQFNGFNAYFSTDGGVTTLANYAAGFDPSLYNPSGAQGADDLFNANYSANVTQTLSAVDVIQLSTLGYNVGP